MLYTPIPQGMGDFFLKYPGRGILKHRIPQGPRGGGYFLDLGYGISICYERENDIINSEAISCTNDDDDNEEDDDGVI